MFQCYSHMLHHNSTYSKFDHIFSINIFQVLSHILNVFNIFQPLSILYNFDHIFFPKFHFIFIPFSIRIFQLHHIYSNFHCTYSIFHHASSKFIPNIPTLLHIFQFLCHISHLSFHFIYS